MRLFEEPVGRALQPQQSGHRLGVRPRHNRRRQHHQVRLHLHRPPKQGVVGTDHQFVPPLEDLGGLAASIDHPFVLHPVVELLIPLAKGPHVDVEDGDPGVGQFIPHQMGVLGGVHAADAGAIGHAGVRVAGTDTVDEDHVLRLLPVEEDLPRRRAGGGGEPLELQAGEDVGIHPVAELRLGPRIDQVEAGGDDDGCHVHLNELLLLVEVDGVGGAGILALERLAAHPAREIDAGVGIDRVHQRDRLREGDVDRGPFPQPLVEGIDHPAMHPAGLSAGPAPFAQVLLHVPGLLLNSDVERSDLPFDGDDLGVGHQLDVGVLAHVHHLGGKDAGGAVQRGEGFVQLGHSPANTGLPFDQVDREAGVGQV